MAKLTTTHKTSGYAFASSDRADALGFPNGCWYVGLIEVFDRPPCVPSGEVYNIVAFDHPDTARSYYNSLDYPDCEYSRLTPAGVIKAKLRKYRP